MTTPTEMTFIDGSLASLNTLMVGLAPDSIVGWVANSRQPNWVSAYKHFKQSITYKIQAKKLCIKLE